MALQHETVFQLHQEILRDRNTTSDSTIEIVNILGGIDSIIADYLTNDKLISSISNDKLQRLHNILSKSSCVQWSCYNIESAKFQGIFFAMNANIKLF